MFPHMLKLANRTFWEHRGLTLLDDLYTGDVLAFFTDLQTKYDFPKAAFYWYLQFYHALQAQFGINAPRFSDYQLIGVLRSQGPKGLISDVYSHLLNK